MLRPNNSKKAKKSKTQHRNEKNKKNGNIYCFPDCLFNREEGDDGMLRCCTCMRWVHPQCCGDQASDIKYNGVYNCSQCRCITERIYNMELEISKLQNTNDILLQRVQSYGDECQELKSMLLRFISKSQSSDTSTTSPVKNSSEQADEWKCTDSKKHRRRALSGQNKIYNQSPKESIFHIPVSNKFSALSDSPERQYGWSISPETRSKQNGLNPNSSPFKPKVMSMDLPLASPTLSPSNTTQFKKKTNVRRRTLPRIPEVPTPKEIFKDSSKEAPLISPRPDINPVPSAVTRETAVTMPPNQSQSTQTSTQNSDQGCQQQTTDVQPTKPTVSIIGNSLVRNTGELISKALPDMNTCVYSTSGLNVNKATNFIPKILSDSKASDSVVLYLGTTDVKYSDHLTVL